MAFASNTTYFDVGDGSIIGSFVEKECGGFFEFSLDNDWTYEHYPHKVWVTTPVEGIDSGFRYALVKKTVCYILVDVDENGPVLERWYIKDYRTYMV